MQQTHLVGHAKIKSKVAAHAIYTITKERAKPKIRAKQSKEPCYTFNDIVKRYEKAYKKFNSEHYYYAGHLLNNTDGEEVGDTTFTKKQLIEDYGMTADEIDTAAEEGELYGLMFVWIDINPTLFIYHIFMNDARLKKYFTDKIIDQSS